MRIRKKHVVLLSLLVLILLLSVWIIKGNTDIVLTEISVVSENLPEGFDKFRIVQISDLHNSRYVKNNEKVVNLIKNADADIIVITGDMIDSRRLDMEMAVSFAEKLMEIAPTFYSNGNHESRIEEYPEFKERLSGIGITVLEDENVKITSGGDDITLIGMIDPAFYMKETDKKRKEKVNVQLSRIIPDDTNYKILLSHRPELFDEYVKHNIDLVFSGHAHGGQVVLPKFGGVYAPGEGFFPKYCMGIHTKRNTNMIVSRGVGDSGFRFRINNKPEIIVAELIKKK
ncbi:MAG: metallophosphoesterase [Clostridia bacterium]|nr:metallophosphoesterase [Clostridia bacterium]